MRRGIVTQFYSCHDPSRLPPCMTSMPKVRRAAPADAYAIAATHVASWQVAYRGFFPDAILDGLSIPERQELWQPRLAATTHTIWVSESNGKINGFLSACPSRDDDLRPPAYAEIAAIYIHPEAWGMGCGTALCGAALEHLRQSAAQTVIVWVLVANTRARRFYEQMGFTEDDRHKDITLFNVTLPEVRYRQSLR